jgi:hypothetical protein
MDDWPSLPVDELAAVHVARLKKLRSLPESASHDVVDEALSEFDSHDQEFALRYVGTLHDQLAFISEGCRLASQQDELLLGTFAAGFVEDFLKDKLADRAAMTAFYELSQRQSSVARSVAFVWIDVRDVVKDPAVGQTWISLIRVSAAEIQKAGLAEELPKDWGPLLGRL